MEAKKNHSNGNGQTKIRGAKTESDGGDQEEVNAEPASPAVGGRLPRKDLTPLQLRGLNALLTQPTIVAAAEEIEVSPRTLSRWIKQHPFRTEYLGRMTELQVELWRQMLDVRVEVWGRFLELMRSPDERIALRASTWFLDRMLSVPAMLAQISPEDDDLGHHASPSLRAFLNEADADEHGNEDDVE